MLFKRLISTLLATVLCFSTVPAHAEHTLTAYDMAVYRDKTTAGIIGQVAGLLSGFEFIWRTGAPWVPLPEE